VEKGDNTGKLIITLKKRGEKKKGTTNEKKKTIGSVSTGT
jgi:hypothetical protein